MNADEHRSQIDRLRGDNLFQRTQRLQRFFTQRSIDFNHCQRFTTALAASEIKSTDIHATLPQDCSNAANHAGHVVTARHEHVAVWCRLEIETVNLGYTPFAPLFAITKERSGQTLF